MSDVLVVAAVARGAGDRATPVVATCFAVRTGVAGVGHTDDV